MGPQVLWLEYGKYGKKKELSRSGMVEIESSGKRVAIDESEQMNL